MRFTTFVKQSELIVDRLTSIYKQINEFPATEALTEKQVAKVKLLSTASTTKYQEFERITSKLYSAVPESEDIDDKAVSKYQATISDTYVNIQSTIAVILRSSAPEDGRSNVDLNSSQTTQNVTLPTVNLPRLNLPKFTGQPDRWIAFHGIYENTVHKSENISNVEKFSYLLSCLSDEPLNLIKSLPLTNANYFIAWESLLKRYHNTRLLITLHVNNLLDLSAVHNPDVSQLRNFLSAYQENSQALHALGHDVDTESLFLTTHILRKFGVEFRSKFEQSRNNPKEVPKITEFIEFVETVCQQLEAANLANSFSYPLSSDNSKERKLHLLSHKRTSAKPGNVTMFTASSQQQCSYCSSQSHNIYQCTEFRSLTVPNKQAFIKDKMLCQNCFGSHKLADCKSKRNCSVCNRRHHTMIHIQHFSHTPPPKNGGPLPPRSNQNTGVLASTSSNFAGLSQGNARTVLLATALVLITSEDGNSTVARAVLDSAAQTTFITEHCANVLRLHRTHANSPIIHGVASSPVRTKGISHITLSSLSGTLLASSHPVIILEKITQNLPSVNINPDIKLRLKHLLLADPTFDQSSPIDLLIGADLFALCLQGPSVPLGENMPMAINTMFGFVILGAVGLPTLPCTTSDNGLVTMLSVNDLDLHASIQRFWSSEEPPQSTKLSSDDEKCEEHFMTTHSRTENGRYVCRLPFKSDPTILGDSSKPALRMLYALEKKFERQPEFHKLYSTFMNDYEKTGHMKLCLTPVPQDRPCYYLPHHGVIKDHKIRVVFNASAETSSNVSLNDVLHQGPKLHNEITDIILMFRLHRIVFTCDIKQMFRQIGIAEEDQLYQLIFWRDDTSQKIKTYKLTTVTYGMKPSPYLANRVVRQLIKDEGHDHPLAAEALLHQLYVDDALLGCDDEEQALRLQEDIIQLLRKGGFELRKWLSSSPRLLEAIPPDYHETPLHFRTPEQPIFSVLGLRWTPASDVFCYLISAPLQPHTKRTVLSAIAKIYDPTGWLTPVVLYAKALMQHIWTLGLEWDVPLPTQLADSWSQFVKELPCLEELKIDRYLGLATAVNVQLHGFSDASETAYSACVYLRIQDANEQVTVHLLIAKSRVAPLKRISLPRLELCGAHMLSKIMHYCVTLLSQKVTLHSLSAWCDSTITLSWIHTPSYRLKTYIANRVAEIQEITPPQIWHHIASAHNPADCGSRGLLPKHLLAHPLWWTGPDWLKFPCENWPSSTFKIIKDEQLPEMKTTTLEVLSSVLPTDSEVLQKFSSWTKLVHVIAYVMRFIRCLKTKKKIIGPLNLLEYKAAIHRVCWIIQREYFLRDLDLLKKNKTCTIRIQRLAPFLDEEDIIRVGGRLRNSSLAPEARHPILLPQKHHAVNLLIDHFHHIYLHCGPQFLQATLSQRFWILSARSIIRSRIFKCMRCFRMKPPSNAPLMGDLPLGRVTPSRPFSTSGIDYAGPFKIKVHLLRRAQPVKVYLCLFICFATKAIHLEAVTDLTSEAFLAALTRFVSRRGLVSHIYSDCGTNFVGAAAALNKCFKELIRHPTTHQFAEENNIVFHFLPPHAPHQGGLWERAVKSAKHHLHRVIGEQVLTYEEFITLTSRVEAILNSRPIIPLSTDPNDLEPLTPGHFLTGGPLKSVIEPQLHDTPCNRLRRWQQVQAFAQQIWLRWQQEYLHTLQQRSKWNSKSDNLKIGDLVIVHDSTAPPLQWKMGRITGVSPGKDGIVRVVQLKTATGNFSRPATKVSRLPEA